MTRLPESAIGNAYANGVARDVLEDLVAVGPRMAGQDGERRGPKRCARPSPGAASAKSGSRSCSMT